MTLIRGTALAGYRELVRELGGDPDGLLRAVGLNPEAVGELQRRLAAEGMSFCELVDDVRRRIAKGYLRDTDMSLGHLASELGYVEQSALTRASRRWFGSSPRAHRRALRARAVSIG